MATADVSKVSTLYKEQGSPEPSTSPPLPYNNTREESAC